MYFEIETGKVVDSTKEASIHFADGHLHLWYGPMMSSTFFTKDQFHALCYQIDMIDLKADLYYEVKFNDDECTKLNDRNEKSVHEINAFIENDIDPLDANHLVISFSSGANRVEFGLSAKHFAAFVEFLKKSLEEYK